MALEWLGYIELVDRFTFRKQNALSIPKAVRERAFSLQVDIEIVSTDGNDYENIKSIPNYGFFGYATLVFRNYAEIQIPIAQPRQRLYYGRVSEAYTNWYQLYLWRAFREYTKGLAEVLGQIGEAVGLGTPIVPPVPCLGWSGFEELPLREVYIKTREGTQYRLEISRWEAVNRTGDTDCDYDPISNQEDDTSSDGTGKDQGLPPLGVQPQRAPNSNFPYAGLEPPSTAGELDEYGNSKDDNLDFPNPDNSPETEDLLYWAKVTLRVKRGSFDGGCSVTRVQILHYLVFSSTTLVSLNPVGSYLDNGCSGTYPSGGWEIQFSGGTPFGTGNSDTTPTVSFDSGLSLPPDQLYFE